jgi:LmbE family N-acetylglucosaminyl deacetylase
VHLRWVVFTAEGARRDEAGAAARRLLAPAASVETVWHGFRDGYLPAFLEPVKEALEALKAGGPYDLILTHWRGDAHQDHRLVGELTVQTFRDHLILEYEVPKFDGDLGRPQIYVPLTRAAVEAKCRLLEEAFVSQRDRDWFDAAVFSGLARLRGMECRAPEGYAEAFHLGKAVLSV